MHRVSYPMLLVLFFGYFSFSQADQTAPLEQLQSLSGVHYHKLETKQPDRKYHIFVKLPRDYSDDQQYPTVYLLDGGVTFPLLTAYHRYLSLTEEVPATLIVGISYGTDDWRQGNMRNTDFTVASDEVEYYGGAPEFQQFLSKQLLPLIEQNYSSRPDRRVIFGQSLGGRFVLYSALTEPGMFWGHIASNAALHDTLAFFLSWRGMNTLPDSKASRVFMAHASDDDRRFWEPRQKWIEHWTAENSRPPWQLEIRNLAGHSHTSSVPAAYRLGMAWLFSN